MTKYKKQKLSTDLYNMKGENWLWYVVCVIEFLARSEKSKESSGEFETRYAWWVCLCIMG